MTLQTLSMNNNEIQRSNLSLIIRDNHFHEATNKESFLENPS